MDHFAVYYIHVNVLCILLFGILIINNHFNIDKQEKKLKFEHALIAFLCYFLVDSFWAAILDGLIPKTHTLAVLFNFLLCILMAAITYNWLQYVMAVEQTPHRGELFYRFGVAFPFLLSMIILSLNFIIAPQMLMDEELKMLPAMSVYLLLVPCIYIVAILFYALRKARVETHWEEKRRHLFIGLLPLVLLITGMHQVLFFVKMPLFCSVAAIMMLLFYIQSLQGQISVDPLTNLNNRGELIRYLSQKSNIIMNGRKTVAVMMDINRFKAINDTYGHAEGDYALVIMAGALKKTIGSYQMPSFLGRYGGDEFILVLHPENDEETDQLIEGMRSLLERNIKEYHTHYNMSVSLGYDELTGEGDTMESCIQRADKNLYLDKKQGGNLRPSSV